MGNDFYGFFLKHKIYLLAHLANGYPALWSPSEAAGFPFFSSALAQYFYPFNVPLVLWYKLAGGYSSIDHQLFTIFGLSIFGLGLYYWLKLLNINLRAVVFGVLIMTVSFRLTESLRFPNGIHTAAWYPWILYALTRIYMTLSIKKMVSPCLILFFSSVCMITGGYPYFVYYSVFLLVPYALMLSFRSSRMIILGQSGISWKAILPALGISGIAILLLGMPYLICIKRLAEMAHCRSGNDFNYSTYYTFTTQDTLGALIYPPLSQMEGWYFFSLTGLLLVILFFVWLFLSPKTALPSNSLYSMRPSSRKYLCLLLIGWMALISYISYGKDSYLFKLLWLYMPGFSILRVWGRLNIILIPLIAWLLAMAYDAFEKIIQSRWAGTGSISKKSKISLILVVTGFYSIILYTQLYLYINQINDPYWKAYSGPLINLRIWFLVLGGLGFSVVLFFLIWGQWLAVRINYYRFLIFAGLWFAAALEMWPVGAHIWSYRAPSPSKRIQINPASFHLEAFNKPRITDDVTVSIKPVYTIGLGSPTWYFESYVRFLHISQREKDNRDILLGVRDGRRIFLSESLVHNSIYSFLKDSLRFQNSGQLVSYNGDELVWELDMPINGYLSFIDNWDPHWKAYVDNKETQIELLFGTFKSIPLTQGKHRVIFRYEPTLKAILFGTK
ncbi:YfhO family protein [Candidatus Poribacteria bacterium]|nr:YfhO family protein [Candidatus Poribacteria bacterium]